MGHSSGLINWQWLVDSGRIQEASSNEDYILVGSFDTAKSSIASSRTREYMIKVSDFMAISGGLTSVTSDATLTGDGTVLSPLGVVPVPLIDVAAEMSFAASDQITPLIIDTNIAGMFAPFDMQMNNMAFSAIRVEGSPGFPIFPLTVTTVDINVNGVTVVLNLSIEAGEATSLTFTPTTYPAPTYIQIGGAPPIINKGDYISVDVTALSTNATEAGLQITINGIRI